MPARSVVRRRLLANWASVVGASAVAASLAACALPDQRTFGAAAYLPPKAPPLPPTPPPPPWPGPAPLATIHFDNPSADYAGPLGKAVTAAVAAKPDVVFIVVGVAPSAGTPAAQQAAAADAATEAREVMQAIAGMGVPTERLLLAARTDPTITTQQVEVYVR